MLTKEYANIVKNIKEAILISRFKVAQTANKEMLILYFNVGKTISEKVASEKWGSKTIEKLSNDLQNDLKGLRGFSATNLKRMKQFYETWSEYLNTFISQNIISPTLSDKMYSPDNKQDAIGSLVTDEIEITNNVISPLTTDELYVVNIKNNAINQLLTDQFIKNFVKVSFTSHYEIITKAKSIEERIFYINKSANEFWTVNNLKHQIANNLFQKQKQLPNNFKTTLQSQNKEKALASFRDHYLLDYIRISEDDENDERLLENEIVLNIKKFIMSLGSDFSFIGNQYRLIVEDDEYFIDLLFYNRTLQALVAFELKAGKFKPEYLGKMNFYLSALDEYVKKKHENPSIGIILCKEKKNKTVEFAFRDFNKAMGVATYNTSKKLPKEYKNILPDEETLKKLLD